MALLLTTGLACSGSSQPRSDAGPTNADAGLVSVDGRDLAPTTNSPDTRVTVADVGSLDAETRDTTPDARPLVDAAPVIDTRPIDAAPVIDTRPLVDTAPVVDGRLLVDSAPTDATEAAPEPRVSLVADVVLSTNATAVKSYDTNVNVASYRQHGLLFHSGYQFVSWYNGNTRNVIVARRTLDPDTLAAGAWKWAYLDYRLATDGDSHNVISLGISPSDGRLHVALGKHGQQLSYVRSVANAVTGATWDNTVFGGTGSDDKGAAATMDGLPGYSAPTTTVTYPYFMNTADGTLQLAYRTGSSGNGEMQLAEYAASNWTDVGTFTSAAGSYTQNGVTATTRNAYPHGLHYDQAGRVHMAFTWRENLSTVFIAGCSSTINNHDTLYIYSDDKGRTWKNSAGQTVAKAGTSTLANVTSPGLVVDALPVGRDLMNQETQAVDHQNLFHAVISYVPGRYQSTCATDRSQAQPFHLWRSATGAWTKTEIRLDGQDVNQGYDRGKLFVDADDNLYLVLPDMRVLGASRAQQWTDWRLLYDGRKWGNYGETIIDYSLTRAGRGVSVLYMKDTSASTGELHVLDLKIGR